VVEYLLNATPSDADALVASVHGANRAIADAMSPHSGSVGMGTTIAAILVHAAGLAVGNVGDSVVLELIDGRLVQLSTDDVPRGLTRLGYTVHERDADPRRRLLSTDGLTSYVPQPEIITSAGSAWCALSRGETSRTYARRRWGRQCYVRAG